ncbi:MAG: AI-2E family transporter [Phycisphaerales bacterium]|nr:AI-2E family transporter [Phycisphaerales bacterium]
MNQRPASQHVTNRSEPQWFRLHLWQLQPVRDVALVAALLGIVYLGSLMSVVTVPLLLGLTLAYLFEPIIAWLSKRMSRHAAAALVIATAYVSIGVPLILGTGFAVVQGAAFVRDLREDLPAIREQLLEYRARAEEWGLWSSDPAPAPANGASAPQGEEAGAGAEEPQAAEAPRNGLNLDVWSILEAWLNQNSQSVAGVVAGGGANAMRIGWQFLGSLGYIAFMGLFLTPLFFFFLSVAFGKVRALGASMIPERDRDKWLTILQKMDRAISGFVRGRIVISAIVGTILTIGWWIVGVPAPLILGPVTGAMNIVPYLGLVGWIVSVLAFWISQAGSTEPATWWLILLLPTAVYWTAQTADDYLLTPLIQGKSTGLSTPMVIVAVFGGASLGGIYGLLLAIPVAACLKIFVTEVAWPRYRQWVEGQARDPLPIENTEEKPTSA